MDETAVADCQAFDTAQPAVPVPARPITRADLLAPLATIAAALAVDAHIAGRLANKGSRARAIEDLCELFLSVNAALERATGLTPAASPQT